MPFQKRYWEEGIEEGMTFSLSKENIINYSVAFAFAGMLIHKRTLDITFIILISMFFILIFKENLFENMDRDDYLFIFFLSIFPISVFLNMVFLGFNMAYFEKAWRLFLGIPIFFLIRTIGLSIRFVRIGIFVGLIFILFFLIINLIFKFDYFWLYDRFKTFLPPLQFGLYLSVLVFIYYILSYQRFNSFNMLLIIFILVICLFFNKTRAAWLLLPFMVFIYTYKFKIKPIFRITSVISVIVLLFFSYIFIKPINQRINEGIYDVKNYFQNYYRISEINLLSLDSRLEMYRYSLTKFKENPIFGAGYRDFYKDIDKLVKEKKFNKYLLIKPRIHSDLIGVLGYQGITGLICYLTFIFGLFYLFKKRVNSVHVEIKNSALIGILTIVGYFLFYQTDTMFGTVISNNYFTFIISVFYGYIKFLEIILTKNREIV